MNNAKLTHNDTEEHIWEMFDFVVSQFERNPRLLERPSTNARYFKLLYKPDDRLKRRLADYRLWHDEWVENRKRKTSERATKIRDEDPGQLMEELAFLAFSCLKGYNSIKAGQTEAAQHDLIISGSTSHWLMLMTMLHLPRDGRTILVEAKNLEEPITDQQLSRLGYILQNKYYTQSHLGVFFSRNGATSFPEKGDSQQRQLRDARATQILFHAMTRDKFIVVLSHEHIIRLDEDGSLVFMLEAAIRDVEDRLGSFTEFSKDWHELEVLPEHFLKHIRTDKLSS